jgi:hypothetical protein
MIMVEPSRKRGPFDPRWTDAHRRRHLRLVPAPAEFDGEADAPAEASEVEITTDHRLASVTYLPTFIPTGPEHDGDVVELELQEGEEDPAGQVAAVLLVPKL